MSKILTALQTQSHQNLQMKIDGLHLWNCDCIWKKHTSVLNVFFIFVCIFLLSFFLSFVWNNIGHTAVSLVRTGSYLFQGQSPSINNNLFCNTAGSEQFNSNFANLRGLSIWVSHISQSYLQLSDFFTIFFKDFITVMQFLKKLITLKIKVKYKK